MRPKWSKPAHIPQPWDVDWKPVEHSKVNFGEGIPEQSRIDLPFIFDLVKVRGRAQNKNLIVRVRDKETNDVVTRFFPLQSNAESRQLFSKITPNKVYAQIKHIATSEYEKEQSKKRIV